MWKLLPWFSCHASLTLLILVLQTALAELLDNPPEDQLFRRGLSRGNGLSQVLPLASLSSGQEWPRKR